MYPVTDGEHLRLLAEGHRRVPADAQIGLALGAALQARGAYEDAIKVYEGVLAAGGTNDFVASNLAGLLLDVRSDAPSHARALELASRFDGATHPFQLGVLGWAYYRNGQYPSAVAYLERALANSPAPNPQLRYYLGMAYLKAGNAAGARQQLRQAMDGADAAGLKFTGLEEARSVLRDLDGGNPGSGAG
jgi:tetratricopeptide (TPR) repeat protein